MNVSYIHFYAVAITPCSCWGIFTPISFEYLNSKVVYKILWSLLAYLSDCLITFGSWIALKKHRLAPLFLDNVLYITLKYIELQVKVILENVLFIRMIEVFAKEMGFVIMIMFVGFEM